MCVCVIVKTKHLQKIAYILIYLLAYILAKVEDKVKLSTKFLCPQPLNK